MAVEYCEKEGLFTLRTNNSVYQMKTDKYGHLLHLYYGARVEGSMEYLITYEDRGFSGNPYDAGNDRTYSMDALPLEYPVWGVGDFRTSALIVKNSDNTYAVDLRYAGYEIVRGKYKLPGLPAVYAAQEEADTLKLVLKDEVSGLIAELYYGVLEEEDIITRSVKIINGGKDVFHIEKAASACMDFLYGSYELIHFHGRHAMERNTERVSVMNGVQSMGSMRGTSSHEHNPFFILAEKGVTEDSGNCYGFAFVYSGGFKAEIEKDQYGRTRAVLGLQNDCFSYPLHAEEEFYAPEAVLSFSGEGLSKLSRNYHRTFRHHLCRGRYKLSERPVLINSWEAAYFDFDGEKIYKVAEAAAELGMDMLVLDDGWFGKRDDDLSGLGDWYVNERKLGGGLKKLADRVNALGLKFGIWMEPEMVSEDSDLYREHPDWAFAIPGRRPVRSRYQLVLDFSRKEVVDYIYAQTCKVLDSANIEYLKWDMNRSITDVYSACAAKQNYGAVLYHYMLGLYDFLERLVTRYPRLLIEGCSGGGGRFDAGMLYYTPQIWCSDNTDAIDRIRIQYGTSFGYPLSAVGSHVSAVPNHQTGRTTPLEVRGITAMAGSFGYELDPEKMTAEEKECVKEQIKEYKKYQPLIYDGDYYRLSNPFEEEIGAWEIVSRKREEALLNVVTLNNHANAIPKYIKMKGLNPGYLYRRVDSGQVYRGSALMNGGIPAPSMQGDYRAWQVHFVKTEEGLPEIGH